MNRKGINLADDRASVLLHESHLDNEKLSSISELLLSDGILCKVIQTHSEKTTICSTNSTHILSTKLNHESRVFPVKRKQVIDTV